MYGSVKEWCHDWYDESYYQVSPTEDPQGPQTASARVQRGDAMCRSASRYWHLPESGSPQLGFRVALILPGR